MIKKLAIIGLSALLLGGCTLNNVFQTNNAATDANPDSPMATPTPTVSPDLSLEAIPSTTTSTDVTSLETDINNTKILDEDFSDIQ